MSQYMDGTVPLTSLESYSLSLFLNVPLGTWVNFRLPKYHWVHGSNSDRKQIRKPVSGSEIT